MNFDRIEYVHQQRNYEGNEMNLEITASHREAAYLARRILRAKKDGQTYKRLMKQAGTFALRLVEVYPLYSERWCIAKAETLAIQHVLTDRI